MNLLTNLKNFIEKAKNLSRADLEVYKYAIFILIIGDMFGVYYYLGAKKLGMALMVVMMIFLAIILLLEKNLPPQTQLNKKKGSKMPKEKKPTEDKEEEEEESGFGNFDTGLPSAEEYNKDLEKAFAM